MSRLPRILLIALIGTASTVSVTFPAWSGMLQIEGYGDYVDLQVSVTAPPGPVFAGTPIELPVRTANAGPQTAEYPHLTISADPTLNLSASIGCVESPALGSRCTLGHALAPDSRTQSWLMGQIDPNARGTAIVGVFAGSEANDVFPGNELSVIAIPIYVRNDLSVRLVSQAPAYDAQGRLVWELVFENIGPSSARLVRISLSANGQGGGGVSYDCRSVGSAICPLITETYDAYIGPGARLIYTITMPPLSESNPFDYLHASTFSNEGGEYDVLPNFVTLYYYDQLFSNGIESP